MTTWTGSRCGAVAVVQEIAMRRERTQNLRFTAGIMRHFNGNAFHALFDSRNCRCHPAFRIYSLRHRRRVSASTLAEADVASSARGDVGSRHRVDGVVLSADGTGEPAAASRGSRRLQRRFRRTLYFCAHLSAGIDALDRNRDRRLRPDRQREPLRESFQIMSIEGIPQHPVPITDRTFDTLGLTPNIVDVVRKFGFVHPTPIQAAVIPLALTGVDVIGLAETGSGKTAAFVLPLAERLVHGRGVRGLILSPTREIALQTKAFLDLFGANHQLHTACLIGGVKMSPQIKDLRSEPDIVVATPGRLLDHVNRRNVKLDDIEYLVLDEADHMLDLGFLPQMRDILRKLPRNRQTMMFSATMPDSIEMIARDFMNPPDRIDITPEGGAATGITHRLYLVKEEDKRNCLITLLAEELGSTLVFVRRKIDAEWLYHILQRRGHPVSRIHADRSQGRRVEALAGFRQGQHRILVATDIAGRGIDVPGIEHVINFDIPENVDDYVHRAGRTARGAALGIVSTIVSWQDVSMVKQIEEVLGEKIPRCTAPGIDPWVETEKGSAKARRPV